MKQYNLGSCSAIEKIKKEAEEFFLTFPRKAMEGKNAINSTGEYISNSKNAFRSYQIRESENVRYCQFLLAPTSKDCMDLTVWGVGNELDYEAIVCGLGTRKIKFGSECWPSVSDLEYCRYAQASSSCFGCVNIRNKQYCILNKQYTKEDYEKLRARIIEHMNQMPYVDSGGRTYRYGEFVPAEFSPFAYNQTIAQEFFPLTKEEAEKEGYRWADAEDKNYQVTIKAEHLPDRERDIPLPRLCPNCRHEERIKKRNPIQLWKRNCAKCGKAIETSYAPDRPEIIYCEECYLAEIV